ncbi:amino acid ABC transporter permease [Arthrobacter pigmenti]
MTFYIGDMLQYLPLMLQALWVSIYVSVAGFFLGSVIGVFIALARNTRFKLLRIVSGGYVELMRNTPVLVQLYLVYFGLGQVGINLNPLWAAVVALTANNSAYTSEIFRAGFESVPVGLREAGSALGMSFPQIFRYIMFKPAIRNILPALTNQFIILFLFSSVGSVISLNELTSLLLTLNSQTLQTVEVFTVGAILYYLSSAIIAGISRTAERVVFRW